MQVHKKSSWNVAALQAAQQQLLTRQYFSPACCGQDTWRTVTVDDRIPLDLFGEQQRPWLNPCSVAAAQLQLHTQLGHDAAAACAQLGCLVLLLLPRALAAGWQPPAAAVAPAAVQGHPEGHGCLQEPGHDPATPGGCVLNWVA